MILSCGDKVVATHSERTKPVSCAPDAEQARPCSFCRVEAERRQLPRISSRSKARKPAATQSAGHKRKSNDDLSIGLDPN